MCLMGTWAGRRTVGGGAVGRETAGLFGGTRPLTPAYPSVACNTVCGGFGERLDLSDPPDEHDTAMIIATTSSTSSCAIPRDTRRARLRRLVEEAGGEPAEGLDMPAQYA